MKKDNQITGNVGLYYVCYQLSKRGWNCLPTSRNAKGVDLLIYSQDAERKWTIQIKALSKKAPVPFGSKPQLYADFLVICRNVFEKEPEVFIFDPKSVLKKLHRGEKEGNVSYWFQPKEYDLAKFKNNWDVIGEGS